MVIKVEETSRQHALRLDAPEFIVLIFIRLESLSGTEG